MLFSKAGPGQEKEEPVGIRVKHHLIHTTSAWGQHHSSG